MPPKYDDFDEDDDLLNELNDEDWDKFDDDEAWDSLDEDDEDWNEETEDSDDEFDDLPRRGRDTLDDDDL